MKLQHANTRKYTCKVMPLDKIPELADQEIGLMKIDTEGHKFKVLQGAQETIRRNMPVILMEGWHSKNGPESESIQLLKSLGYKTFLVPVKYPQHKRNPNKILNMIFRAKKIATILIKGEIHGLEECDFSSPSGYEMIIAHA